MAPPKIYPNFEGLEHLNASVLICDSKFSILYVNPSAEALLELSHDQACHQNLELFVDDATSFEHAAIVSQKTQSTFRENEFFIKTKQKKTICVTLTLSIIGNGENFLIEMLPMDQQVKIAKEERMFIQQQANTELLRNLAHEIRNPLGGLRGAAQLLEKELGHQNLKEYTNIIISEADRLQKLMNKLLSPHQIPSYQTTNIHEVIERVRGLIVSEFEGEIEFIRDYDVSLPEFVADREKLIQALLNIARNAIQAMISASTVKASLKILTRSERQIIFHKKKHSNVIRIDIIDNGPGISPHIKDKIFYPLVSGSQEGTGLGLSLAQNFISLHKGMIEVESKPGKTKFSIILPIENNIKINKVST